MRPRIIVSASLVFLVAAGLSSCDAAAHPRFEKATAYDVQGRESLRDAGSALVARAELLLGDPSVANADGEAFDEFGAAIAVDGDTALISAPLDDVGATVDQGSVYVFVRIGGAWELQAKLTVPSGAESALSGSHSIALEGDVAVIGAQGQRIGDNVGQGAAYVFQRDGDAWSLQAQITAVDGLASAAFGAAVALSGSTAVIGAPRVSVGPNMGQGAAYVFVRNGAVWTQQARLVADDGQAFDTFGAAVAISGDEALVGSPLGDVAGVSNVGKAYVFARQGGNWAQTVALVASDGAQNSGFARTLDIQDGTAVIGAGAADVGLDDVRGSAYVFRRDQSGWVEVAKLVSDDGAAFDAFGSSVDLSSDILLIGTLRADAAYVFERSSDGSWHQAAKLNAEAAQSDARFGAAVALSGGTALIGAPSATVGPNQSQGEAHAYVRAGSSWSYQGMMNSGQGSRGHRFGLAVALGEDIAVVATPTAASASGTAGVAYVFGRTPDGWRLQQKLAAADGTDDESFGSGIALSGDTVLVGAPTASVAPMGREGAVYVFVRTNGAWILQARLVAPDGPIDGAFGSSLALSGDSALIGAPFAFGATGRTGAAYVFVRDGSTWAFQAKLAASGAVADDRFGSSVAISGNTAVVGAPEDDVGSNQGQGSAYVYSRVGTAWTQRVNLLPSDAFPWLSFGSSVAIDDDEALIGAPSANGVPVVQGAVYRFTRTGSDWAPAGKLTALAGTPGDRFGAALALSGSLALVGAPGVGSAASPNSGSLSVFARRAQGWIEQDSYAVPDVSREDQFASAVALHGTMGLAGSPGVDGAAPFGNADEGVSYVLLLDGLFNDGFEDAQP